MTDTTQPGQAEHSLWSDEAMHAAYKGAFEKDPDVHHWALLCWIRDDMAQALAAAQERITELEAQLAWKEGLIQQLTNVDMAAMDAQIERLTAQLAERSEWMPVPDGIYQGYEVDAEGKEIDTTTKDVHGIEWDAMILLPDDIRLCRRVQREDEG